MACEYFPGLQAPNVRIDNVEAAGLATDHLVQLHAMAEALLEWETIDAAQIDDIMENRKPGPPKDWVKTDSNTPDVPTSGAGPVEVTPAPQA